MVTVECDKLWSEVIVNNHLIFSSHVAIYKYIVTTYVIVQVCDHCVNFSDINIYVR
jgi:hypothetical protein